MNEVSNLPQMELTRLQKTLERVIRKIGLERTTKLLDHFDTNTTRETIKEKTVQKVLEFLKERSVKIFSLDPSKFYASEVMEYRDARMVCYYLLHRYTQTSYAQIALLFQREKRSILYYCQRLRGYFTIPDTCSQLMKQYHQLENELFRFLTETSNG